MSEYQVGTPREELEKLGLILPQSADVCRSLVEYINRARGQERDKRIQELIEAQQQFCGKRVYKLREPGRIGTVQHVRPLAHHLLRRINGNFSSLHQLEVFVKWSTGKYSYANLSLLGVVTE